ncbi:MAG: S46 family peptidase [Melioribacteraceae bacterium]|nr:S46 family peptidase [Melioribacteraceae bacterium]MCF8262919.1 S46 family peptidase [Melioribacteraceae bacterium]MCF8431084.1 S46 family peptidase [Melioribacteraceae bacterium]
MKQTFQTFKRRLLVPSILILSFTLGFISSVPEEGMYPLSDIPKNALVEAGLKMNPDDIYNPEGISLIDGLVKVGGCTGSFVSEHGLIITNHHCAFGAISRASTTEDNYLENGFLAELPENEIPATGYTVRITESYEDVSEEVLAAAEGIEDLTERANAISNKMRELGAEASDEENSIEAQVSEMFVGQTYILFNYRIIRDVRLVYAPPRSIGEFGGETDNWVWPRHTGDFSFMRAYVAPDGSAAEYSTENIPFQPKNFLKVNPNGVEEGDFVFILGYPGRTYRHQPSQFLEYQQKYQLPYISKTYEYIIDQMNALSKDDEGLKLQFASLSKGLANVEKNYRGKLKGLRRIQLVEKKKEEEKILKEFINADNNLSEKYGNVFSDFVEVYETEFKYAQANLWFGRFYSFAPSLSALNLVTRYAQQKELDEDERDAAYQEENLQRTISRAMRYKSTYTKELDRRVFAKMITDAMKFDGEITIDAVDKYFGDKTEAEAVSIVNNELEKLDLLSDDKFDALMAKSSEELDEMGMTLIPFAQELYEQYKVVIAIDQDNSAKLKKLQPVLAEAKRAWKKTNFIPDANSTLRLTYGHVKGYSPADAIYHSPLTTLDGVIDKSYEGGDYEIPEKLRELYDKKDFGRFYHKKLKSVPVALLYNMDTTGGNSGSPILNAYGELIGVNFDRAFEATINDYAWNEAYSRSIGVDIRYVLWITQKFGGADNLLREMGVDL